MANMCINHLIFQGEELNVEKAKRLFKEMAEKGRNMQGQVPDFVINIDGYLFDIVLESGYITFESKWTPPLTVLTEIGRKLRVGFTVKYEELGMHIFGKACYDEKRNVLKRYDLGDFDSYSKEESSMCEYKGEMWESEQEVLEDIFKNKFQMKY